VTVGATDPKASVEQELFMPKIELTKDPRMNGVRQFDKTCRVDVWS
jgi:hypothetical protein